MAQKSETLWCSIRFQPQQCKQLSCERLKLTLSMKTNVISPKKHRNVAVFDLPILMKLAARKKFQCWLLQESLSFAKPHDFIDRFGDSVPTLWPPDCRDVFRETASIFKEGISTRRRTFKTTGARQRYTHPKNGRSGIPGIRQRQLKSSIKCCTVDRIMCPATLSLTEAGLHQTVSRCSPGAYMWLNVWRQQGVWLGLMGWWWW